MAAKKQHRKSKPRRGRKSKPLRKIRKEYLKEVEVVPTQTVNLNTPYLQIKAGITGGRARQLAALFGEYRIRKITYTFRPWFDTFTPGIATGGSNAVVVPTLYWRLNRYGDMPAAFNGDYMRAMGAKAIRLDDKVVSYSYAPNIIQAQQNVAGSSTATIKVSPWLSTDDLVNDQAFTLSTAEHFGHTLFIEAAANGSGNGGAAYMDVKVVYEFRNPRLNASSSPALDMSGNQIPVPTAVTLRV